MIIFLIQKALISVYLYFFSLIFRLVQHEYDNQDASGDNPQADLADHIKDKMGSNTLSIKNETLMSVKDSISVMAKECEQKKPQKIMPPRLKKLTEALNKATGESEQWKELHHARKNKYNMAKIGNLHTYTHFCIGIKSFRSAQMNLQLDLCIKFGDKLLDRSDAIS